MDSMIEGLADLPHPVRMQRLMELGRRAVSEPGTARALRALQGGDTFARWLAVKSCYTARDGAMVLASVRDPSRRVRAAARKLVALACDDAQALTALQEVFATRQHTPLLRALRSRRRSAPIDAFLDWLRVQPGETLFADVLPLGSEAAIERHLAHALARHGFTFWDRMRRFAPASLARLLTRQVEASAGHPDGRLRAQLDRSLVELANSAPDETIALWAALRERGVALPHQLEPALARHRPQALADRVLAGGPRPVYTPLFQPVAHRLTLDQLHALARLDRGLLGAPEAWLARRPEAEREGLARVWVAHIEQRPRSGAVLLRWLRDEAERERAYRAWTYAARNADGVIALDQLRALPVELRQREARRHLREVTQLLTRPAQRLPYAELLPWEEARQMLHDHLGHPEGEVRGPTLATLLRAAAHDPSRPALIEEALGLVKARKNEQDPVRSAMLGALLTWPREVWRREHLPAVGQIVRDGLDAADLSHGSAHQLEALVVRLFALDGGWGATWLTTLARERGRIHNPRLGDVLGDDEVRAFAAPLLELARAWARHERDGHLLALAQSLGARLTLVAGLPELLEQIILAPPYPSELPVLSMLFQHDRPRYDRLLPGVLRRWLGASYLRGQVAALADAVRDLAPPLLDALETVAQQADSTAEAERALHVLRFRCRERFERLGPELLRRDPSYLLVPSLQWLAHRRRQDLLTPYLGARPVLGRFASGKTSWLLPFRHGFERWSPGQHALYERSLGSVCADHERDTPTIGWCILRLQALDYVSGQVLTGLAADDRAAVQEMALRALGRLDAGQGIPTLLGCMDDQRARVAIYALRSALLSMPPAAAVAVLRGVPLRKITVAKEVARLLGELRSDDAYRALLDLARTVTHRDVRVALLRALWDHLERDETWDLLQEAALGEDWILASRVGDIPPDRLSDRSERRLSALLARVLDRPEPEARLDLLRRAASLPIRDHERHFYRACLRRLESRFHDEIAASVGAAVARATEHDLDALVEAVREVSLHRRVLQSAVQALTGLGPRSSVAREASRRVLALLADDPLLVGLHTQVATRVLSVDELVSDLTRFAARGWLDEFPDVAQTPVASLSAEQLEGFERALRSHPHHALRLAALRALESAGRQHGWTPDRRARLVSLQADPSPRVAIAAQFVSPPDEEPPPAP